MSGTNIRLILVREIRDQLRDRRTMFVIVVLPILLYPLLGMVLFQVSQFVREVPTRVLVVGARNLPDEPPLWERGRFAPGLFSEPDKARLLEPVFLGEEAHEETSQSADRRAELQAAVERGQYEAVLLFPADFGERWEQLRQALRQGAEPIALPQPEILFSSASEKSQLTYARLKDVLRRWGDQLSKANLGAVGVPEWAVVALEATGVDLAEASGYRGAAAWSKLLPVLLVIWALTGAFYPAVDLCAGEKERGTLETLLSSPAERSEIVLGKLLTIMLFSMVTAVLNVLSMAVTGTLMLSRWAGFGPPPLLSPLWLALALVPASALFSALCLALAAMARSTKEGQYYLMPLLLVTLPLAVLPAAAGLELNLGNSLIPVTGLVLWLRSALEGNVGQALQFAIPVTVVTLAGCWLAIRWAVEQFHSESVLFRESERFDLGLWLRHVFRDREPTPRPAEAILCGLVILLVHFFLNVSVAPNSRPQSFALLVLVVQVVAVLTPALIMTVVLTSRPWQTLRLGWPGVGALGGAVLLAVVLHPAIHAFQAAVLRLYPLSEAMQNALQQIESLMAEAPLVQILLLVAVVPAVCEELAFRGFILSGLRHWGSPWRAIVVSAVLFGLSHAIMQQSLVAFVLGLLVGWVAVRTGSVWPGMAFHLAHNALVVLAGRAARAIPGELPVFGHLVQRTDQGEITFAWPVVWIGGLVGLMLLVWLGRLGASRSVEEPIAPPIGTEYPADA